MRGLRWAAAGWTLAVFCLHAIPRAGIDAVSLARELSRTTWADKLVHAVIFGLLGWLWQRALGRWPLATSIAGLAYAGSMEVFQTYFVRGRTGSVVDVACDGIGLLMGITLALSMAGCRQAGRGGTA